MPRRRREAEPSKASPSERSAATHPPRSGAMPAKKKTVGVCGCPWNWCYQRADCRRKARLEALKADMPLTYREDPPATRMVSWRREELEERREALRAALAGPEPQTGILKRRREAERRALSFVEAALQRLKADA